MILHIGQYSADNNKTEVLLRVLYCFMFNHTLEIRSYYSYWSQIGPWQAGNYIYPNRQHLKLLNPEIHSCHTNVHMSKCPCVSILSLCDTLEILLNPTDLSQKWNNSIISTAQWVIWHLIPLFINFEGFVQNRCHNNRGKCTKIVCKREF